MRLFGWEAAYKMHKKGTEPNHWFRPLRVIGLTLRLSENGVHHRPHGRYIDAASAVVVSFLRKRISLGCVAVNLIDSVGHLLCGGVNTFEKIFDTAHIRIFKLFLVERQRLVGIYGNADSGEGALAAAYDIL